jgi:hypothetical protein
LHAENSASYYYHLPVCGVRAQEYACSVWTVSNVCRRQPSVQRACVLLTASDGVHPGDGSRSPRRAAMPLEDVVLEASNKRLLKKGLVSVLPAAASVHSCRLDERCSRAASRFNKPHHSIRPSWSPAPIFSPRCSSSSPEAQAARPVREAHCAANDRSRQQWPVPPQGRGKNKLRCPGGRP